jgi:hypothetical protein
MGLLLVGLLAVLFVGAIAKVVTDLGVLDELTTRPRRITWLEFALGALACAVIVVPVTVRIGNQWALNNNLTFHEFWSGYETEAVREDTECQRDGACQFTYRCDPYEVTEVVTVPNADGKGSHTETRTHTEYHSCPEATMEWDFTVRSTLGDFHIERTFPDNAQPYRGDRVRGDVRRGVPPFWTAARDRIAAGTPGPVTVKKDYENYILASQSTILHKFSGQLDQYKSVLPKPASTRPEHDFYYADKVYTVGMDQPAGPWQFDAMRFNAAFGSELQGDLHVVLVGPGVTNNPDDFTGALNAYWTGTELGQDAISKNALVVVIGTDGTTVQWARAFTGMPRGNEALVLDIQNQLKGQPLDADTLFGNPVGTIANGKLAGVTHYNGALEKTVWGVNQFKRVCMTCKQEGGSSFTYLGSEIQPNTGQKVVIVLAAMFLSLIVWGLLLAIGTNPKETP